MSATPPSCVVTVSGQNSCSVPVAVTSANTTGQLAVVAAATGVSVPVTGANTNAGTATVTVPLGQNVEFRLNQLSAGSSQAPLSLVTLLLSASCGPLVPLNPATGLCTTQAPVVYKYASFSFVVLPDITPGPDPKVGYMWQIKGRSVTPMINLTPYQNLSACGAWDKLLPSGAVIGSCTTPLAGNLRRNFTIDPVTGTFLSEYLGAVPEGAILRSGPYGDFNDTPYVQFNIFLKGQYIDVAGVGTYFYTATNSLDQRSLRLTINGFISSEEIFFSEGVNFMMTFSNP